MVSVHEDPRAVRSKVRRLIDRYGLVAAMVVIITLLHYNTAMHIHQAHGIYRRLYYFPIIIAAFRGGTRGGLLTALAVCALYLPHAYGQIAFDPEPTLEKILELVLYVAVGVVCGLLVDREGRARRHLEQTAVNLQQTLDEKSAMERELVRNERLAAVGQLSAGLAHEIRNPLASIKGSAEVIADDFPSDHPKGVLLRILKDETERLNDVLTRFLQFARPMSRGGGRIDLAAELRTVADLMAHRDDDAAALHIDLDIPATGNWTVAGDGEQVRQLLLNLALNAAAAAGRDGQVHLALQRDGDDLVCLITDDGPGFSAEALASFGTPFFSTREGGTGLGLAISVRIVQDHGGTIGVVTTDRPGACVRVTLPAAAEPEDD